MEIITLQEASIMPYTSIIKVLKHYKKELYVGFLAQQVGKTESELEVYLNVLEKEELISHKEGGLGKMVCLKS